MISLFELLKTVDSKNVILSGQEVANYIEEITPDEGDIPHFFLKKIIDSKKNFQLVKLSIKEVLASDDDARNYVEYSIENDDSRYGDDSDQYYEPKFDELDNPIVILDGEVLDGYSRLAEKIKMEEDYIWAYSSID